jgi:hypothetical protein
MGIAGDPLVAVVVQALIPAEVAGVLFTVDPHSGSHEHRMVEAKCVLLPQHALWCCYRRASTCAAGYLAGDGGSKPRFAWLAGAAEALYAAASFTAICFVE